ncbi:Cyanophycinase [Emticicia aquatica]|uniref:Cyanophycinase n=1 Tax=Emticicia aquatica TaxID=1681835 RepID=A0ABN8EXL8_9BACT|nr:cyanophycinase [Emticicia aquatica]CAH0997838.1 Cyanophycinase [Emticicia aquatica]
MTRKLFFIFLLSSSFTFAQERLILIGGGKRTPDVLAKFIEFSGNENGKILVIPWASGEQEIAFSNIKNEVGALSKIAIENAPLAPLNTETKAKLVAQLKTTKGVFFCGGDQNRIMEVLKDDELFNIMHEMYKNNVVFAGTSAGTAIMSEIMITGEGDFKVIDGSKVETKKGLGLINNIIVDQHFIKRQRQNRLIGLIFKNPTLLGVGIDENTALVVEQNRYAEVLGESQVMIFEALKQPNEMKFLMLQKGKKFDLKKRKIM